MEGNRKHMLQALFITISLGVYFTLLQASEYYETSFTISDGVYGSTFFMATGFHGLHVIIGSTFLIVCFLRQLKYHFTSNHHFGFDVVSQPGLDMEALSQGYLLTLTSLSPAL